MEEHRRKGTDVYEEAIHPEPHPTVPTVPAAVTVQEFTEEFTDKYTGATGAARDGEERSADEMEAVMVQMREDVDGERATPGAVPVMPVTSCGHTMTICTECFESWQLDHHIWLRTAVGAHRLSALADHHDEEEAEEDSGRITTG